ncbi:MAG: Stage III sporulation protein AF [Lachnoclostridium sp.]|jgi:stage III sporulation protein AF
MNEIYGWVKNIVIFLVLTTIINNLLGKSTYKKYVDLVTGIILVIMVIFPLLKLFQLEKTMDYYFTTNFLMAEAHDINSRLMGAEEEQRKVIFREYKEYIEKQVHNLLEEQNLDIIRIETVIDEDENSTTFGKIKNVTVIARYDKSERDKSGKDNPVKIDKVEIDDIKIDTQKEADAGETHILTPDEINIKNLLSDFYNMNSDNINISIQE